MYITVATGRGKKIIYMMVTAIVSPMRSAKCGQGKEISITKYGTFSASAITFLLAKLRQKL